MNAQEFTDLPIVEAVRGAGAVQVVTRALAAAEADRTATAAFCALNPEALAEAEASEARHRAGAALGPLDGVPVAVKDNMLVRGMTATWGSEVFADRVAGHDEIPVERLRAAGAIVIGKTNTPAFSARGHTRNTLWGVTRNPLDLRLTPGGSSGGTAAALAAGIVDLALGTDGGGSTRRPAAHCGVVGLKPSIGFIPRGGGFLPLMHDLEVVGPMARDMAHLRRLVDCLAGPDARDPRSFLRHVAAPARALRIGWFTGFDGHPVAPGIRETLRRTAARLAAMGHDVTEVQPFFDVDLAARLQGQITDAGFAALDAAEPRFARLAGDEYRAQAEAGRRLGAAGVVQVLADIGAFRARIGAWFADFDVLLIPAVAAQAWPVEQDYPDHIDGQPVGPRGHAVFTGWVNVAGHPALSIPSGDLADGLPVGVQLVGAWGADRLLLDLGAAYEVRRDA